MKKRFGLILIFTVISLALFGLTRADVRPGATYPVSCGMVYLPNMNDNSTIEIVNGSLNVDKNSPMDDDIGTRKVSKLVHGFNVIIKMEPLVQDGDKELKHGFSVSIQIDKSPATSFATTTANSKEPFRRLSNILGLKKEQITVNCDITQGT